MGEGVSDSSNGTRQTLVSDIPGGFAAMTRPHEGNGAEGLVVKLDGYFEVYVGHGRQVLGVTAKP